MKVIKTAYLIKLEDEGRGQVQGTLWDLPPAPPKAPRKRPAKATAPTGAGPVAPPRKRAPRPKPSPTSSTFEVNPPARPEGMGFGSGNKAVGLPPPPKPMYPRNSVPEWKPRNRPPRQPVPWSDEMRKAIEEAEQYYDGKQQERERDNARTNVKPLKEERPVHELQDEDFSPLELARPLWKDAPANRPENRVRPYADPDGTVHNPETYAEWMAAQNAKRGPSHMDRAKKLWNNMKGKLQNGLGSVFSPSQQRQMQAGVEDIGVGMMFKLAGNEDVWAWTIE